MQVLLDTNIIIHRETQKPRNTSIMALFQWMNKLKYEKLIHPYSIKEIEKHSNPDIIDSFTKKMGSYSDIKTIKEPNEEFNKKINSYTPKENDYVDNILLYEVYLNRVNFLITEDRTMIKKSETLGIRDRVYSIGEFITKCTEENPDLVDIKGLKIFKEYFGNINLNDKFFDSLKASYDGFEKWFNSKANDKAYIAYDDQKNILGFLALKKEEDTDGSINPPLDQKRLKIRTFKTVSTGFRLGERFLKIALDNAIKNKVKEVYVTIFDKEELQTLKEMFYKWGFEDHGKKSTGEDVLVKKMTYFPSRTTRENFPYFNPEKSQKYFLPIEPSYHRKLFAESVIKREKGIDYIDQTASRYAIQKTYITFAYDLKNAKKGDIVFIYRKGDREPKHFYSTVTAICIIDELIKRFDTFEEFVSKCENRSVFSEKDLKEIWENKRYKTIVKLLHVKSSNKNITLAKLREFDIIKITEGPRPFHRLNHEEYLKILKEAFKS